MQPQAKKILVTVKTYPNPSKKYGETVCCAGIDLETNQWVRLYPIPFRDLEQYTKFKKYSVITVNCSTPSDDKRPESFRVDRDSIRIQEWWDSTKDKWQKRKEAVLKLPIKSMCQVCRDQQEKDLSLAIIKPIEISFESKKKSSVDLQSREACYAQFNFLDKPKSPIEVIPYDFYYKFRCQNEPECPSHKLSIIDWELGASYRSWRSRYPAEENLLEMIEQQWRKISDITKKDVYFYVGNIHRFPKIFMVLGTFYPPKDK